MKKILTTILGALAVVLVAAVIISGMYTVKTGEVGIISTFGKVTRVEESGLHFKIPLVQRVKKFEVRDRVYYFNKSNEFGDTSLTVNTKDMQQLQLELAVQASISDPKYLYEKFEGRHETRLINQRVKELTQSNISKFTIEEFISKRIELSKMIYDDIKKDLEPYGVIVNNVSLTNHDFSDEYERAVEEKKIAEQAVEKMRFEQDKQKVEAESKVKLAEFNLQEKELQAKANLVESASLTPELLEKQKIEKWDGRLPQVQGNATPLINLSDNLIQDEQ